MLPLSKAVLNQFEAVLKKWDIPLFHHEDYKKWFRYYHDFCDKYPISHGKSEQVRMFLQKLREKKQTQAQRQQAAHAVALYFEMQNQEIPLRDTAGVATRQRNPTEASEGPPNPEQKQRLSQYSVAGYQKSLTLVAETGERRRYHLHESQLQEALYTAVRRAQIPKRVTAHTFRHSYQPIFYRPVTTSVPSRPNWATPA